MPRPDAEIDRLYQLPLAEFTAARNALAKREPAHAADIRALAKPTVPAWAVNQLYWKDRPIYDRLIERAADLRSTHNAALRGRRTDLRGASRAHDEAFDDALKATLAILAAEGHPVTNATRQAIATTLRALPGDEPPGRLSRQLQATGFQMLGVAAPGGKVRPPAAKAEKPASTRSRPAAQGAADKETARDRAERIAAAREAVTAAAGATREAESVVRREEFELARATRAASKAIERASEAEDAWRQAEAELADARKAAAAAERDRDEAKARAARAAADLEEARAAEQAARKALERADR